MRYDWRETRAIRWLGNALRRGAHALDAEQGTIPEEVYQLHVAECTRQMPEYRALTWRYHEAWKWMESNFDTLDHWRRYVEHVEALMVLFREEERDREPCRRTRNRQPFPANRTHS